MGILKRAFPDKKEALFDALKAAAFLGIIAFFFRLDPIKASPSLLFYFAVLFLFPAAFRLMKNT